MTPSTLHAVASRLERAVRGRRAVGASLSGERLPLAGLWMRLDDASASAVWAMNVDGVLGRSLMLGAGGVASFPLVLDGDVTLTTRVMLLPHDWRDGIGQLPVSIAVCDADKTAHQLWSATLASSQRHGRPRGHAITLTVPSWATGLQLRVHAGATIPRAIARAIWLSPELADPTAELIAPAGTATTPAAPAEPAGKPPLISVLTPVHDPPLEMVEEAIASVQAQTYPNWQLCLVDDGSRDPEIIAALQHHADHDPRIHLTRHDTAQGIATATNAALAAAAGDYIALLDHDDTLTPDALHHVADQITIQPELDMIYTDEDVVDGDTVLGRHVKPGWSPEHLTTAMYTCHFGVYRRSLALELGGFHSEFDGTQDYDFVLRVMERTDRIAHIPRILYHWRAHATSTAGTGELAKPFAYLLQRGALGDHHRRRDVDVEIQFNSVPGFHRVVHHVDPATTVEIVLAVSDERGLTQAAVSWLAQAHPTVAVVLAGSPAALVNATTALAAAGVGDQRLTTITTDDPDTALSTAARAATADQLLLMQTPAMGLTHDWLTRLIGYSSQPGIAAAGPVVLARDGRIQEAGIAIPDGIPLPLRHGMAAATAPPVVYNVAAVSGVLATSRDTFERLGGLDPAWGRLGPVDYCLRASDAGRRVVVVPDARVQVIGDDGIGNDLPRLWRMRGRWAQVHTGDPYYNPSYRTDRGDFIPGASG